MSTDKENKKKIPSWSQEELNDSVQPLMQLAQAHFTSQALYTIVQLHIPDILGEGMKTIPEIASEILETEEEETTTRPNQEALLRTLRLLCSVGILHEHSISSEEGGSGRRLIKTAFSLSPAGALLQAQNMKKEEEGTKQQSLAPFVSHWTEKAMWDAWSELPSYVAGRKSSSSPFEQANQMSIVEYYKQHPKSAQHRNNVARYISPNEIQAVLTGYNWNSCKGKVVVDVGGGYGDMMYALSTAFPDIKKCICMDLPEVISSASTPPLTSASSSVKLVGGDMFQSIPPCDVIFMKHVFCDWNDEDAVQILHNCNSALPPDGKIILADALLPSGENAFHSRSIQVFMDALLMVVGSRMERSVTQLVNVASLAGFCIESVDATASPSVNITVLSKER